MLPENPASAGTPAAFAPPDGTVALNLGAAGAICILVVVAVAFDWVALKGVLVVGFLSVALAYLLLPIVRWIRREAPLRCGGWRPSKILSVLIIYAVVGACVTPIWSIWGGKIGAQLPDVARDVPMHVSRFVSQVRASERWHEQFTLARETRAVARVMTRRVSDKLQAEIAEVGAEVVGARLVVPWLAGVPVLALLLVTQWPTFHRAAARALPTPHLKWRTDQVLRQVNSILAAYTRAQALSALIVGVICGCGFALMKLPNAAVLGIVAGLLETVPIAGPLAVAISATSVAAPSQVLLVLAFLGTLRVTQDYVIYPRLISQALHLHPIGVVVAIWAGAMIGGVVGVCLAVPVVGITQVLGRNYREYSDIERLVRTYGPSPNGAPMPASAASVPTGTASEATATE